MKLKQFLLVFFLFLLNSAVKAELLFKPYLGLGQSSISLGNGNMVKGNMKGYLLGLRLGLPLTNSIYVAFDYSRGGPYDYVIIDKYQNNNYPNLVFNIFSGGAGIGFDSNTLTFWVGYYPYHSINEYTLDFSMKGALHRTGIGLRVGREMEVMFLLDSSSTKSDYLPNTAHNILCSYANTCEEVGTYSSVTFGIGAKF